jgi:NitT/TauT family transport system permease protein
MIWEMVAGRLSTFVLPPPSTVLLRFFDLAFAAQLLGALGHALQHMLLGFGLALLVAIPLGVLMGRIPWLNAMLDPVVSAIFAIPTIAFVPFFIIWFGLFFPSRVALVFAMAVIDMLIVVVAGARDLRPEMLNAGRSFGATRFQLATKVMLPAMMPFLLTAARIGLARAINGMITAELFFAAVNLGAMMKTASRTFDSAGLLTVIVLVALVGLLGQYLIALLESRVLHWKLKT